ncbi:MAG TPA: ABC transporter permease [Candidatus Eisenbacteria bacterium]|nr:ABC transporter permease [Candidatus Eisenbacteria bacterium]
MAIDVREGISIAFQAIRTNKLRSFLTVLGVIIGITSIMAIVSLIEGLNRSMKAQIAAIGSDVLYIRPFRPGAFVGGFPDSLRRRKWFTIEDAEAIRRTCPAVRAVAPLNFVDARLRYRDSESRFTTVIGTTPEFLVTNTWAIANGRFFTETEVEHRATVCVLGKDQIEALFPHANPIGKTIYIGGYPYTVVGQVEERGKFIGMSLDDIVIVPYTTLDKTLGPKLRMVLNAKPYSPELMDTAIDQMTETLRRQRKVAYRQGDNFAIFTDQSLVDIYKQITGAFYLVMIVISGIGLMVGGIGVMNIMLVSVTERTREIGVRKALGARRRDILWQFLVEAMTLTGTGGVLGILIGIGAGYLVHVLAKFSFAVPLWGMALGFLSSTVIGLFFGIYPAVKAAQLDPVDSLRYE